MLLVDYILSANICILIKSMYHIYCDKIVKIINLSNITEKIKERELLIIHNYLKANTFLSLFYPKPKI